ncbi:39S ribosomal protein L2, mitochondrial-like isoform X2 [Acanthaster planci]|uniref:39S ribosomal protein L2, mitochondrial-like isoform X2 n=1 Tax=Acanthaster planci TaxID=133434 RepID=A0A8B7Z6W8_ACAPL|nr:39S ribosomal protein L2, mitochondrial-like isoform X2 [Acanthaster planci]
MYVVAEIIAGDVYINTMALAVLCRSLQSLTLRRQHDCQQIIRTIRHYILSPQIYSNHLLSGRLPVNSTMASVSQLGQSESKSLLLNLRKSEIHTSAVVGKFVPWKNTPKYTIRPLGLKKSAGRNRTGRITVTGRGGGHKRRYRMIDFKRIGPEKGEPLVEKVLGIRYDPCRTANIALIAGGNRKRWILATVNMEAGDIIKTSGAIGRMTVAANEGDAYPLGALPIGCLVHNIELFEGEGGRFVRAAGTSAQLIRKTGGQVILQLPSKQQISVSEKCMATVGRVSNENHNKKPIGKAGRNRWLGRRPSSGLWQRKGGWAGRKIKPIPPIKVYQRANTTGTHIDV